MTEDGMGSKLTIVSLLCLPTHIFVYYLVFKSWLRPWAFFYISTIVQTAVSRENYIRSWLRPWAFFYISTIIQTAVSRENYIRSWLRPWAFLYISTIIQIAVSWELHKIMIKAMSFLVYIYYNTNCCVARIT